MNACKSRFCFKKSHTIFFIFILTPLLFIFQNCTSGLTTSLSSKQQISQSEETSTPSTPSYPVFIDQNSQKPVMPTGYGETYHIRVDGGTATQCNGKFNLPYSGSGTNQNCAWKNPMIAIPPEGMPLKIAGGDLLIIHSGQYRIGLGAQGADGPHCSEYWPYECVMQPIPSGPDVNHPTRIVGEGYDSNCSSAPELFGVEKAWNVVSLEKSNNVFMSCLEITDHSSCVYAHGGPSASTLKCNTSTYPHGDWASTGLVASDSANVTLVDINIHGLANRGVSAGRLKDWNSYSLRIAANGWAGWDGDISGGNKAISSSNSGTMRFTNWIVEWNGCGETYPEKKPIGCWAQSAGGYGDGVGTGETGGLWIITDSKFLHNTSDGLDLLYHNSNGSTIIDRVWAEGNAGNQLKVAGQASVKNSIIIGNCGFFDKKTFSFNVDNCRAAGDALAVGTNAAGQIIEVINNTIVSEGNVAILAGGVTSTKLKLRNNIMVGLPMFISPEQNSADTYIDASPGLIVDETHALKQNLRHSDCTTPSTKCVSDAGLLSINLNAINPRLKSDSPAIGSGQNVGSEIPEYDFFNSKRILGTGVDRGAIKY